MAAQPVYGKSNQRFRGTNTIFSASVASDRGGNERGVGVSKRCRVIKRGFKPGVVVSGHMDHLSIPGKLHVQPSNVKIKQIYSPPHSHSMLARAWHSDPPHNQLYPSVSRLQSSLLPTHTTFRATNSFAPPPSWAVALT